MYRIIATASALTLAASLAISPSANAHPHTLSVYPTQNTANMQAGWDTLDYVFNTSPRTARALTREGDTVSYVGMSSKPVSMLPLVSFRGHDARGKATNHVFVFTKSANDRDTMNRVPAYQFNRLAKVMKPCKAESSTNMCVWDATKRGNGKGRSFININWFTTLTK